MFTTVCNRVFAFAWRALSLASLALVAVCLLQATVGEFRPFGYTSSTRVEINPGYEFRELVRHLQEVPVKVEHSARPDLIEVLGQRPSPAGMTRKQVLVPVDLDALTSAARR